jgi:hypothetical protein
MSKLLFGKINLSKIDKTKLFKGEKGIYLDLTIWLNDTPDKFGNDMSIEQSVKQGEDKNYIGSGKYHTPKEPEPVNDDDVKDLPF